METLRRSGTEGKNLHVVADTSFPDWQGLCLREQACAGLGLLFTGCRAQKREGLTGTQARAALSCTLGRPTPGWGPWSLQADSPQGSLQKSSEGGLWPFSLPPPLAHEPKIAPSPTSHCGVAVALCSFLSGCPQIPHLSRQHLLSWHFGAMTSPMIRCPPPLCLETWKSGHLMANPPWPSSLSPACYNRHLEARPERALAYRARSACL